MKTFTTFLLSFYLVPSALSAQPVIAHNEFYYIGDVISMVKCDAVNAGSSGAAVTWDFSVLSPTGGLATTTILHDTSITFGTSNLLEILPDGRKMHVQENSTDTYVNGIENTASGITYNYYNYNTSKRPFTYNTSYVDSYQVIVTTPFIKGGGSLVETGDAYGTLILPSGTYENVLRIKKRQLEADTAGASTYTYSTTVSYLWFDTLHNAPLFRIDSVTGSAGTSYTAMYLVPPTAVTYLNAKQNRFSGYLKNNDLFLSGSFEQGKAYEIVVYNIIGSKVFSTILAASGTAYHFDINRNVNPGIYMVSIVQKDDPSMKDVIKLVTQ